MSKIDELKLREIGLSGESQFALNSYNSASDESFWGSLGSAVGSIGSAIGSAFGSYWDTLGSSLSNECEKDSDCLGSKICEVDVNHPLYPFFNRKICRKMNVKELACVGKNEYDSCEFSGDGGRSSRCLIFMSTRLHCSDLN